MKEIHSSKIADAVAELCVKANRILPCDIKQGLDTALINEPPGLARDTIGDLVRNYELAEELGIPVCQDTGIAVVFVDLGQDVHISGETLDKAINLGVARGYTGGLLRCSVVADPLRRVNTENNTPAIIHVRIVPGDNLAVTVAPKGAGSENMSVLKMLNPSADRDEIIGFVKDCMLKAGGNPCPPVILGVGIGGNFESCAALAKRALCRGAGRAHSDPFYAKLEVDMLEAVNFTGIGPQGFGGSITALAVNIETAATHIASLPVAVNVGCHVTRHATTVI